MLFDIYDAGKNVGKASLYSEGMFWRIECSCRPLSNAPCRVLAVWNKGSLWLGKCVRDGAQMTLLKRVAKKKMDLNSLRIELFGTAEQGVSVSEQTMLPGVSLLKYARYCSNEDGECLLFPYRDKTSPTGQ